MIILQIEGATRTLGKSQGYLGLPVRDEVQETLIGGEAHRVQMMVTAWEPTPDELAKLNAGAPVLLHVMGVGHPPVRLEVGEPAIMKEAIEEPWFRSEEKLPEEDQIVDTKLVLSDGSVRCETRLRRRGTIWWAADGKTYVMHRPTHWRRVKGG